LSRLSVEKCLYFKKHSLKTLSFELHHIVPLSWAENLIQFKLLDEWRNMLYIDAYSHAKITQNRNSNVILSNDNGSDNDVETLILSDFNDNTVVLIKTENVLYSSVHLPVMLEYNKQLLQ
jgi:hypothetical protein